MRRAAGGERVLLGSMLGLALSPGTIVFYTLGVLMEPITAATGWTRGQVSFAASVFTAVLIFAIPAVGRLLDRFGVRAVLLPSIALFGFALIAAGRASTLWQLYLAFAALAALGAGANSVSYMRAVCTWFDRHRGLAIGIAQSGMGIGVMLMPTLTQALLQRGGWSFAYAGLGACVLLIALPVVALLVVEAPPVGAAPVKPSAPSVEPAASAPAAEHRGAPAVEHPGAAAADGVPPAEALRQLRFWILVVGFFLLAGAINSAALHLVPLLQTSGVARDTALLAASVFGGAMLLGRIMTGLLVDRYFAAYIAAVLAGASTVAIALLAWGVPGPVAVAAAFVIGLSAGSDGDLLSYLVSRYFGMRAFGTLSSLVFSAYLVGTSLFPWLTGVLAERTGSYAAPMVLCATLGVGTVVAMMVLGQCCKPALVASN